MTTLPSLMVDLEQDRRNRWLNRYRPHHCAKRTKWHVAQEAACWFALGVLVVTCWYLIGNCLP